jgi:hypothetical protein
MVGCVVEEWATLRVLARPSADSNTQQVAQWSGGGGAHENAAPMAKEETAVAVARGERERQRETNLCPYHPCPPAGAFKQTTGC